MVLYSTYADANEEELPCIAAIPANRAFTSDILEGDDIADADALPLSLSATRADGADELLEGTSKLADGRLALADGRLALADSKLALADGKLALADGRLLLGAPGINKLGLVFPNNCNAPPIFDWASAKTESATPDIPQPAAPAMLPAICDKDLCVCSPKSAIFNAGK